MAAVALPDWLDFRPRLFPSCNFAWLRGPQPVLVDSGFGTDLEATLALLPDEPALVFNTHWHSDHVGGNAGLANRFGMPIAASVTGGSRVNAGDPESFGSAWLDQPVDPFHVDRLVESGEMLDTGVVRLRVVPAAGHSLGQIALFEDRSRVLIAGDAILAAMWPGSIPSWMVRMLWRRRSPRSSGSDSWTPTSQWPGTEGSSRT